MKLWKNNLKMMLMQKLMNKKNKAKLVKKYIND